LLNLISAIHGTGVAASTNSYESIATTTVGAGGVSNVTFSSIPGTYKHLQIRILANGSTAGDQDLQVQLNSDTGTNYSYHTLYGNGASAAANAGATQSSMIGGWNFAIGTGSANIYSVAVIDVLEYANTNIYKTIRSLAGQDKNGSGTVGLFSGNWRSTSAVTSIKLYPASGNFNQYSSFALYGIKG